MILEDVKNQVSKNAMLDDSFEAKIGMARRALNSPVSELRVAIGMCLGVHSCCSAYSNATL